MLENERVQVKDLKVRGYSVRQLQEMGFCESALHTPSVAVAKPY
jgi:Fe2+ transport system protein FeoA